MSNSQWKVADLPRSPPQDHLQAWLLPLQQLQNGALATLEAEFPESPDLLSLPDLLAFRSDGSPEWWPLNRDENGANWSLAERRQHLFALLKDQLPAALPARPSSPTDVRQRVASLRHIAYGLHSQAFGILDSSSKPARSPGSTPRR